MKFAAIKSVREGSARQLLGTVIFCGPLMYRQLGIIDMPRR
ncbi:MAG: hypothetical protein ABI137_12030 [Antricoccus sp.]